MFESWLYVRILFISLKKKKKKYVEVPQWGPSNEYLQCMFYMEREEKY